MEEPERRKKIIACESRGDLKGANKLRLQRIMDRTERRARKRLGWIQTIVRASDSLEAEDSARRLWQFHRQLPVDWRRKLKR